VTFSYCPRSLTDISGAAVVASAGSPVWSQPRSPFPPGGARSTQSAPASGLRPAWPSGRGVQRDAQDEGRTTGGRPWANDAPRGPPCQRDVNGSASYRPSRAVTTDQGKRSNSLFRGHIPARANTSRHGPEAPLNPQVGDANPPGRTVEVRERQGRIARTESELAQMSWPTTRRHTAGGSKDGAAPSKTWVGRRRADASLPSASDRPGPGSATRRVPQVGEDRDQQVAVGEPARRAGTGARSGQRSRRPRRATTHRPPRDSATGRPGGNLGRAHQHPHVVQDLSDRERKVGGNPPCQLGVPRQLDLVQLALGG